MCDCKKKYSPLWENSVVSELNPCVHDRTGEFYVPDCAKGNNTIPTPEDDDKGFDWLGISGKKGGNGIDWRQLARNGMIAFGVVLLFTLTAFELKKNYF